MLRISNLSVSSKFRFFAPGAQSPAAYLQVFTKKPNASVQMAQIMVDLGCSKNTDNKGERFMSSPSKSQIEELLGRLEDLRGHL